VVFHRQYDMHRRQIEALVQRPLLRWMVARLDRYVLQFTKRSRVDQSGKAYTVPDGSGVVWESVDNSSYWFFNEPGAPPQKVDP
jgi:hypothetical protein